MGKGISFGTSSKASFTVFQDCEEWIWHDFKTLESGNVLTFMEHFGFNAYEAAEELERKFNVCLLSDNIEYYKKIFNKALSSAINEEVLEDEIKRLLGAEFVKFVKSDIRIADKFFILSDFGIDKTYVINKFIENRKKK